MGNGNFGGGTGASNDPYLVEDVADLRNCNKPNKYYKQVADIDLGAFSDGEGFSPITIDTPSSSPSNFSFSYDGGGYKILNLYQNTPTSYNTGLFRMKFFKGGISNVSQNIYFKNINIVNANITGLAAGVLFNATTHYTGSTNNFTLYNNVHIDNIFASATMTSIFKDNLGDKNYHTGLIGTIDISTETGSSTNRCHRLYMNNVMFVCDLSINISNTSNKAYNIGLLGFKNSINKTQGTPYQKITNSCVHSNISVENNGTDTVMNICGITPENEGITITNSYVNIELNNINNSEGVNLHYFNNNPSYKSNLIANHEKGQVQGIEFDNVHYLTEAQMKDLTYYKNLGWTVYE